MCDDGSVYTTNDEVFVRYADMDAYKREFEEGEVDFNDLVKSGRASVTDVENNPRAEDDYKIHLERHLAWGRVVLSSQEPIFGIEPDVGSPISPDTPTSPKIG